MSDDPTLEVAINLRAILELSADLHDQAASRAAHKDIPGGDALVFLAPVASPEAWENRVETIERLWWEDDERGHEDRPNPEADEDPNWEPPLQTLLFWSEAARLEHNALTDARPTVQSEATWLSGALEWIFEHEVHWDDFVKDVANARRRLEAVLYAGEREERSQVTCLDCAGRCLVKAYGMRAEDDRWVCPECKRKYDDNAFMRAKAQHLHSEGADRFVPIASAAAACGRSMWTVRNWTRGRRWDEDSQLWLTVPGPVRVICDRRSRAVLAWWPDVRAEHFKRAVRDTAKALAG